jgi:hypothetical protein
MKLPVIALGANPEPTVGFDPLDNCAYFHAPLGAGGRLPQSFQLLIKLAAHHPGSW